MAHFRCWNQAPLLVLLLAACTTSAPPSVLTQQAFIWQRQWTAAVRDAAGRQSPTIDGLLVLAAEARCQPDHVETFWVDYDAGVLQPHVALVLRIDGDVPSTDQLVELVNGVLLRARQRGVEPSELLVDFDAPESKLSLYADAIGAARRATRATPLTITALPAWIERAEFATLAHVSDGFILQLHSLRLDTPLFDPAAASLWMQRAARAGVPFRIALPTHGYRLLRDASGNPRGASGEGSHAVGRVIAADAPTLARWMHRLLSAPPPLVRGVCWFRLPVSGDELNWSPQTLASVIRGVVPIAHLVAEVRRPKPDLYEIDVVNQGDDTALAPRIELTWNEGTPVAADALRGFRWSSSVRGAVLQPPAIARLSPGQRWVVAWLRFDHTPARVQASAIVD